MAEHQEVLCKQGLMFRQTLGSILVFCVGSVACFSLQGFIPSFPFQFQKELGSVPGRTAVHKNTSRNVLDKTVRDPEKLFRIH